MTYPIYLPEKNMPFFPFRLVLVQRITQMGGRLQGCSPMTDGKTQMVHPTS